MSSTSASPVRRPHPPQQPIRPHEPKHFAEQPANPQPANPQPSRRQQRIDAIDILRGIALIGMVSVHGLLLFNDDGTPTFVTQTASGRSFAIFALLAGVSLALMTGSNNPTTGDKMNQRIAGIAARAIYIAIVGTIAGYLVTALDVGFSVILVYYGVLFLVAIPFLRLSSRALIATAIGGALVSPLAIYLLRPHLEPTWSWQATLLDLLIKPVQFISEIFVVGDYPVFALIVFALAGLAIGRQDLRSRTVAIRLAVIGTAMATISWITASILLFQFGGQDALFAAAEDLDFDFEPTPTTILWYPQEASNTPWELAQRIGHSHSTFDLMHSIGIGMALLGILLLITQHDVVNKALAPLAAAGSMPLTIYTMQIFLLGAWVFNTDPYWIYLYVIVAVMLVFATVWRRKLGRGPLELGALWCARKASSVYSDYSAKRAA